MRVWRKEWIIGAAIGLLIVSGCTNDTANQADMEAKAIHRQHMEMLHDPSVIPSENGPKVHTTNKDGKTTNGMGTTVYSMIGSSGLHANGFSAHLESRLSGEGIPGVRVFVFDDTVVLAAEKREASASQYDDVQKKLLNGEEGLSGSGYQPMGSPEGILGTDSSSHDNLTLAARHIQRFIGGEVKILTAEGAKAVELIERIRSEATSESMSPAAIADDMRALLEIAKP
ncbi:hypothetical protein [Paenibacillus chungangensis]|uniref:Sporulation lipoprotein YhcN/YlaJ n=1 Tax=Paenibacillus chungangensis TaxID=696535 RepID=A0ABW3HT94_9BACL